MSNDSIRWEQDADGVVLLTLDAPAASANTMDQAFAESLERTLDRLENERDTVSGVVIASAKKTFFAGADLNVLIAVTPDSLDEFGAFLTGIKGNLRRLERLGKPVVAVINGAALGGGFEIALAANHRIVLDSPKAIVGFPEVQLGLLPGAGGVTRTVRMLGILPALMGCLLQGQRLRPAQAKELGVVDEIVATPEELLPAAKAWIAANPEVQKPWDADPKYRIPGGTPAQASFAANLPAFPANLRKQIKGATSSTSSAARSPRT
jgi:3-hydroxyacyl-CoA dehydrogenase/enoyl-CoA hydratase/3-hydroxybutyryl-CoA epimerase